MVDDNFATQFQLEASMPGVLVMESSTHFREVLNQMLVEVREPTESGKTTELKDKKTPRLPPIYLTDEELKYLKKENENCSRNIGKFPSHLENEEKSLNSLKMERQISQELEMKDSSHLGVPVGDLDYKSFLPQKEEWNDCGVLGLNASEKPLPGRKKSLKK